MHLKLVGIPPSTRILIVEDELIIAEHIKSIAMEVGFFAAMVASSGSEALSLAAANTIDLAFMDIQLRGEMDGIRTAVELRNRYGVPVVFVTAFSDAYTMSRAEATAPLGYITKPFTSGGIKAAAVLALEKHRLRRLLESKAEPVPSVP